MIRHDEPDCFQVRSRSGVWWQKPEKRAPRAPKSGGFLSSRSRRGNSESIHVSHAARLAAQGCEPSSGPLDHQPRVGRPARGAPHHPPTALRRARSSSEDLAESPSGPKRTSNVESVFFKRTVQFLSAAVFEILTQRILVCWMLV